ncbi:MAG: hypothetical protein FJW36_09850 [Acidobacteria bacterium]|nr:hypothetical protein [Acidobacteriota bacterium]
MLISVFLTGFGAVAYISGLHNWKIDTFIWTGQELSTAMLAVGITGGISVLLAFFNVFRYLLPLVTLGLFGLSVYGFIVQGYKIEGLEGLQWLLAFIVGAGGSFLCSLMEFKRGR